MSYVSDRNDIQQHICTTPSSGMILNVGAKRAGRAYADLHEFLAHAAFGFFGASIVAPTRVYGGGIVSEPVFQKYRLADDDLIPAEAAPPRAGIDADESVARWFTEQQAAAEDSHVGRVAPTADPATEGELILERRGGLRSRAWRGGGTMRRR